MASRLFATVLATAAILAGAGIGKAAADSSHVKQVAVIGEWREADAALCCSRSGSLDILYFIFYIFIFNDITMYGPSLS